jgi:N-acetylglucosaminyldiphosphoundecaprenol N-acetyl-beta-D-mannosaminyltransferase
MRIDLLGVGLDLCDATQVRRAIDAALTDPEPSCRHVVTLNPEYVMRARADRVFREAVAAADLITADGVGVLIGARLLAGLDASRLDRVTGLDLCDWLAESCATHGRPLFLLGGRDGAAVGAAKALQAGSPTLRIAGTWDGGSAECAFAGASLDRLREGDTGALLVAYGAPGQVTWIARNRDDLGRIGVRVAIGVGGAFDYLSGRVPRAPRLVRRLGLEWLYRLGREPWRWRRQLGLPRYAGLVLIEAARRRLVDRGRT